MSAARRGEVWWVTLSPTVGREQNGRRPALIVSADGFNASAMDLVTVLPITSKAHRFPTRIPLQQGEAGLPAASYVITEQTRTVSTTRLHARIGAVHPITMARVSAVLRTLLDL